MNICKDKITEIFYLTDEFCKDFEKTISKHTLGNEPRRKPKMSQSEVITIMILFHYGSFKNMKHFYEYFAKQHLKSEFPQTVSYNRFVELMQSVILPMTMFLKTCCLGNCTRISFTDSTSVSVCKNKRIPGIRYLMALPSGGKQPWEIFWF